MSRSAIVATLLCSALMLSGCINKTRAYHGYIADEAQPSEMEPGIDTRATVLARLGSPSTRSIFDDNTWYYMTTAQESFAFYKPQTAERNITGIRFNEDDVVEELLTYDVEDGRVLNYASRETPTLGRQLTFLEQLLGSIGNVALPATNEATPGNPTGRN
ncbi:MAG: outer membrane protein assembly factor BamE [Hyphomonadaceae bacterium]|nr:outer membrane protein assembly factor BamE [Hyphomonadaceae bacterium]